MQDAEGKRGWKKKINVHAVPIVLTTANAIDI